MEDGEAGFSPAVEEQLEVLTFGTEYGDAELARSMRRELGERLSEGRPLTVYLGVDPTSPNIHLGHAVVLGKLADFQRLGHRVIFVIGDFTAMVGDPTGRSKTRPPLTADEIRAHADTYAEQAFRVLDRSLTELVYNSEWLSPMTLRDVVGLTSTFTLAQLLVREDFGNRHREGLPIHLHEFLYSLLQGQDAVHLKTDVQVGGSDQLFNIMTGRDVMRHRGLAPQVPIIMPILPGTDGKLKMSKSYGNDIGLLADPADSYGKMMSLPDSAMPEYWRLSSGLAPADVGARLAGLEAGTLHPRDAKMELARTIVARWHGADAAAVAEQAFVAQFQRHAVPDDVPEVGVPHGVTALDLVVAADPKLSRGEARRLITQGAVSLADKPLADWKAQLEPATGAVLRVGKRRLYRLVVEPAPDA